MKWFVFFFVILFLLQGYLFANYDTDVWRFVYSIWDKSKDLIFSLGFVVLLRELNERKKVINAFIVLSAFLTCRIIWELIVIKFGLYINDPYFIRWLFYICCVSILYIFLQEWVYKAGIWVSAIIMVIKRKFANKS